MIKKAVTDSDILSCFDVISELRPHLTKSTFLPLVRSMEKDGYELIFLTENDLVLAAAGIRMYTNLAFGKHIYIDDLVTTSLLRSKGSGKELLNWIKSYAKEKQCEYVTLDSGVQRHRAHKFYFKHSFSILAHHFVYKLEG